MARGFAVIDFETTGLLPSYQHRVVEVAVVHVDPVGRITGVWDTLVNPRRDLGPQRIHGVRAIDAMRAPTFDLIAPELLRLLEGRVIVAHNANFDVRFLTAELQRLELWLPPFADITLCTMQLARTFLPGAGRSLADCAAAVGIDLANAHRASADALATAQLLSAYLSLDPEDSLWQLPLDRAGHVQWPLLMPTNVGWMSRPDSPEKQMPFLERITEKIAEFAGASEQLDYLALLDRCLVDRVVSSHEADALVAIAEELGIGRSTCATLHSRYFDTLVDIAWSDGILTDAEILDLLAVADLLDIGTDVVTAAMEPRAATQVMVAASTLFALCHGDRIVLTGEMSRPRAEWHGILTSRGYEPWPAVTKRVAIVVAADVDSLSGKARKARDYGIPVVTEEWLETQIRG